MVYDFDNQIFKIALDYVNQTQSDVFLTGKAGSGKTTFLKYIQAATLKNSVVVSPTGVAAINAGGVTMHSMFQLPFQPFVAHPTAVHAHGQVISKELFLKGLRLSGEKKRLFEKLQLLIIDEVSMLRCDLLDAIDCLLQHVRHSQAPFGGVQVLYIGDLFQLPPVVKEADQLILREYYDGFFFFNAEVVKRSTPVYIELKKIYRQTDQHFIDVLNRIRTNTMLWEDVDYLNQRYVPDFEPSDEDGYITLTTRNQIAEQINHKKLTSIISDEYVYKGIIVADFSENNVPCPIELRLKVGAQVMFVRNDTGAEKRFYNGKIAVVSRLTDDDVYVHIDSQEYLVERETWENIQYRVGADGAIEENILGTYTQFPLRLAWAITIHKSQGLTFEKAIVDIGRAFEFGQVYVALSRCKSFDGMVLLTPMVKEVVFSDDRVQQFANQESSLSSLSESLPKLKFEYSCNYIFQAFDFTNSLVLLSSFESYLMENPTAVKHGIVEQLRRIDGHLTTLHLTARKFHPQLKRLLLDSFEQGNWEAFEQRLKDALLYFCAHFVEQVIEPLFLYFKAHLKSIRTKNYAKKVQIFYDGLYRQLETLRTLSVSELNFEQLLPGYAHFSFENVLEKKAVVDKDSKVSTKELTLQLLLSGKSILEIAEERKLTVSTIEGHLSIAIREGSLDIERLMDKERILLIEQQIVESKVDRVSELKMLLGSDISYGDIRFVQAHIAKCAEKSCEEV